jgi:hypothetical protein
MKPGLKFLLAGWLGCSGWLLLPTVAQAVEWTKVTENSVGDKYFVDTSAIQRKDSTVFYWEYREFVEPNNAFVEADLPQPLYGVVSRWSVDCGSKAQRLRRINTYAKDRSLIQKFAYADPGLVVQSRPGSSVYSVIDFVCAYKPDATKPADRVKSGG